MCCINWGLCIMLLCSSYICVCIFTQLDINECTQNPDICGFGDCSNNDNGAFYECMCQDGAMLTGVNSNGTLTCVGRWSVVYIFNV